MLHRGRPREAIDLLECARPYEMGMFDGLMSTYVRGQAYHALGRYQEAAGEYERIVSYRRLLTFSTSMFPELYPLAHVRLARARAMSGDAAGARQSYEKFFDLWKNADTDIPILIAARREYAKLVAGSPLR